MAKYKTPPIQEAVCEFQFVPAQDNPEWDLTLPGKLQVRPELRDYSAPSRQQHTHTITAKQTEGRPDVAVTDTLFRIQLPTQDGRAILSIGHNILAVSVLQPYEGWENFGPRILQALEVYIKIAEQSAVRRVGLRYINRIIAPMPEAFRGASRYLTGVETTIEALEAGSETKVEGKLTALNTRHEFEAVDRTKLFITHATLHPADTNTSEYLLDIDTVWDHEILDGVDQIKPVLDKLHAIEGGVFETLITEEARKLFNEA